MDILDDMGVNKLLANVFLNVNYSFKSYKDFHQFQSSKLGNMFFNRMVSFISKRTISVQNLVFISGYLCE